MIGDDKCWPGDPSYDDLYGGNQSGCFPEEVHFLIDYEGTHIVLRKGIFSNAGCGKWNIRYVNTWKVEHMSTTLESAKHAGGTFTLKAEGDAKVHTFRVSKKFKSDGSGIVADLVK